MPDGDADALPFPLAAGYATLALNGAKGGATKYLCLQYLNYARWTSQQFSCNLPRSPLDFDSRPLELAARLQIMASHLKSEGRWRPLHFLKFWRPAVTLLNETVHWGMKVPLAMALYNELRAVGPHGGLAAAVALSTAGEVVLTGWSERCGVHMGGWLRPFRACLVEVYGRSAPTGCPSTAP